MTPNEVAQAVLDSLHETGLKSPRTITLSDGSSIQAVITGISGLNNTMYVELIDVGTDQVKRIPIGRISEVKTNG